MIWITRLPLESGENFAKNFVFVLDKWFGVCYYIEAVAESDAQNWIGRKSLKKLEKSS